MKIFINMGKTGAAVAQSQIFPHIEAPSEDIDEIFSLQHNQLSVHISDAVCRYVVVTVNMKKMTFHREPQENTLAPTLGAKVSSPHLPHCDGKSGMQLLPHLTFQWCVYAL
jgi:hypothetical protein